MRSPPSSDNEAGLVSTEWLLRQRADLERSMLRGNSLSPTESSNPVPNSYVEFVEGWLLVQLRPAQRVLCKVCFDGWEPIDLDEDERVYAQELFGDVDRIPDGARDVLAVIVGGRAGKTYLFSLRVLHLALTHSLSTLAAGEHAFGVIIAPKLNLAHQALRYCSGAARSHELLKSWITSDTAEGLVLKRWDGQLVHIACYAASRGGVAARGRSLFALLMDEACFFMGEDYVVNDEEIFKAGRPRVMPGGQTLVPSTPWMEAGLLYDLWKANFGTCAHAIAVHAKTVTMRPEMAPVVEAERARDAANAQLEYDAIPLSAESIKFFDPRLIEACIDHTLDDITAPTGLWHETHCGLDTAFRKDSTGEVIARAMNRERSEIIVAECVEITPPRGQYLKPTETLNALMDRAVFHKCSTVVADLHYIETVREHTEKRSLGLVEAPTDNVQPYLDTRRAMKEGKVRISPLHGKLIAQLKDVVGKPMPGGKLSIINPRKNGSHSDTVSAFVLAIAACVAVSVGVGEVTAASNVKGTAAKVAEGFGREGGEGDYLNTPIHEREQKFGTQTKRKRIGKGDVWG